MQHDGRLCRKRLCHVLVPGVENPVVLVQNLQHADQGILVADERNRQHAARPVAGLPVDIAIETRVGIAIRDVDDLPGLRRFADNALVGRDADGIEVGADKFVTDRVVQEHGAAIGMQHFARCVDNFGQHGVEIEGRGQLARHLEDLAQCLGIARVPGPGFSHAWQFPSSADARTGSRSRKCAPSCARRAPGS